VRNALARFDQVIDVSDADRALAFGNMAKAANSYDVNLAETTWRDMGIHPLDNRKETTPKGAVTRDGRNFLIGTLAVQTFVQGMPEATKVRSVARQAPVQGYPTRPLTKGFVRKAMVVDPRAGLGGKSIVTYQLCPPTEFWRFLNIGEGFDREVRDA